MSNISLFTAPCIYFCLGLAQTHGAHYTWVQGLSPSNLYSRWKPGSAKSKLEALRERRPPSPKQIITPILTLIYQGGS